MNKTLEIKSRLGNYHVHFLNSLDECFSMANDRGEAFCLVDRKVYELYKWAFQTFHEGRLVFCEAREESKTFSALEPIFEKLISLGFKKNSRLLVIGGGILQDIGGFVATTLYRGVEWDLVPTTLLSQADSCIGSKTSVNLAIGKNLLGSFYPPLRVLLTTSVLKTLSRSDICSGLCEAIKLGMVESAFDTEWMAERVDSAIALEGLEEVLRRALLIKKKYIEEDEFDRGVRNLLNYGHTFGHAFERITNYEIPHGIAVGLGIQAANFFSHKIGWISERECEYVDHVFTSLNLNYRTRLKDLDPNAIVTLMKNDKKNTDSNITFILGHGFGKLEKYKMSVERAVLFLSEFLPRKAF